ncbi:hypothetical protein JCM10213_005316 [Rhodosporidiobolus nylandii]
MPKHAQKGPRQDGNKPYFRSGAPGSRPPRQNDSSDARPARRFDPSAPRHRGPARPGVPPKDPGPPKATSDSLDLSGQALTAPPKLSDFAFLTRLNLSNCQLSSISFVKAAARTLTWLNVSGNDLSGTGAWAGIEELKGLFVLNASHCSLTEVPSCIACLSSLKALVLSHNSLKTLEHVADQPDLNTIVVSNNQVTALPSSLSNLRSLKKISAAHNQLIPSGLPDLSFLAHLQEVRLGDNRSLTSLPPHFGSWGKAALPAEEEEKRQKGRQGIEILDLGNCGFDSWFGLRELAKQSSIVNLGLKGNKVTEEAVEASGFDELKSKLTVLLPSLRILDNNRFDAKHADLKAKRASRSEEQKILDAGPMALALNAQRETPVEISRDALRDRERERENRRRRKAGLPEITKDDEEKRRKAKGWKERKAAQEGAEDSGGEPTSEQREDGEEDAPKPAKRDKGKKRERDTRERDIAADVVALVAEETAAAHVSDDGAKKKKRKNRHESRSATAEGGTADEGDAGTAAVAPEGEASETPEKRKRGRKSKEEKDADAAAVASSAAVAVPPARPAKQKKPKGGVLDALRGDDDVAPSPKPAARKPSPPPPTSIAPVEPAPEKPQKTSVAKIIEVKRAGEGKGKKGKKGAAGAESEEKKKEDVGALLGLLGKKEEPAAKEAEVDAGSGLGGGWGAGSGVFGGGGWD